MNDNGARRESPGAVNGTGGLNGKALGDGPIRVLFMNDHLGHESGEIHGVTSYFLTVIPELQRRGVEVVPCFLRDRHAAARELEARGVRPIFLDRSKWDPLALLDMMRIMREHRIHLVHAAGMKSMLLGRVAARILGAKTILHFHDTRTPGRLIGLVQRTLAPWTSHGIAVSEAVRDTVVKEFGLPPSKVRTVYNPIAFERFAEPRSCAHGRLRREFEIPGGAPVIGIIGRMTRDKGHGDLLRALPSVLEQHPETVALVVGDGPTRPRTQQMAKEAGLEGSVRFTGHRPDIPDVLAAIDLLALPSVREGLPYSIMEAMAAGRPVVAFEVGGVPELIAHEKEGLLVPAGDVSALSASILRVLDDPALSHRMTAAARRKIEGFTLAAHVETLKGIYRDVLA